MTSKLDPNQAFRNRFLPSFGGRAFSKTKSGVNVVMIRCGACGHKTIVSRDLWIGEEEITCSNCGSKYDWSVL